MTAPILLLALGLVLVLAEVFFPSFGLLSVLATAALVGSIAMAFQESSTLGYRFLLAVVVLVPSTIVLGFKLFPRTPLGKLMLGNARPLPGEKSYDPRDLALAGKEGVVEADCRPAGMARLDGRRVDVVSRGEWIEAGARVRVLEVQGNRVVVARTGAQR